MKNIDSAGHVTGRSIYLDDIPVQQGTLYALPYDAPSAHAHIKDLDISKAAAYPGVVRILTYTDVTGENQIGGIIPDEDAANLKKLGVAAVFQPGAALEEVVAFVKSAARVAEGARLQ